MKTVYIYPGTFSPPTFGHLDIVRQAAALVPELLIVCSTNPAKPVAWFSPEEGKNLWASYNLPPNVKVLTFPEAQALAIRPRNIVLVRGLRAAGDYEQEKQTALYNRTKLGINKYLYIFGSTKYKKLSSSRARTEAAAVNIPNLYRQVSPQVISALLEKSLQLKNLFLVVGQPGGGKSTWLKMLRQINGHNCHINTDDFNQQLKPLLRAKLGEEDLILAALQDESRLTRIVAKPWLELLQQALKSSPPGSNLFVEIAYGLQADKRMFRFAGGKVIYIGCGDKAENLARLKQRGTPQFAPFLERIPGQAETIAISKKYQLQTSYVDTNCSLTNLFKQAQEFNTLISGG
jgi:pantetheine-phosphate adenylyltransferase